MPTPRPGCSTLPVISLTDSADVLVARMVSGRVNWLSRWKIAFLSGIFSTAASNTDLVIEAAVEKMPLKKAIFHRLSQLTRPDTILATNTSALSVSEITGSVEHPGRGVGIHFFHPAH